MKKSWQCRTLGECWTSWLARPALARGGRRRTTAQNPMKMQMQISRNPMKRKRRRGIRVQSSEPSITFSLSPTSPLLSNVRYFITLLLYLLCFFLSFLLFLFFSLSFSLFFKIKLHFFSPLKV